MTIQLYNTLSRNKESFEPIEAGKVGLYVCGPTVYSDCHIGHLMGPVLFDAIARWFAVRDYAVSFANNITDVDDKIINRMKETGEGWSEITTRYTQQYYDFLEDLHVTSITKHPKCSDYIPQMVQYIGDLVEKDIAYPVSSGVYFDVSKQADYGKLSGRKIEDMIAGARIESDSELRNAADFCLWKAAKPGEPSWESPWGAGRPGWHIECSVMATDLLGKHFDIHGGGDDLKFPHHENEIAQSEAHSGCYAHYWMHNGLIQYEGVKIGKSDPRMQDAAFAQQFNARYLIDTHSAPVVRFFLLQGHYRRPFDFAPKNIVAAGAALQKLHKLIGAALQDETADAVLDRALDDELSALREQFCKAMDDDFNSGSAISQLFNMAAVARKRSGDEQTAAILCLRDCGRLIGLFMVGDDQQGSGAGDDETLAAVMDLVLDLRQSARANRDFDTADKIRDQLQAAGIVVKDGKDGATWERQ